MTRRRKPKLAVWKFASCDGCQLSLARLRGRTAGGRRRGRDRLLSRSHPRRHARPVRRVAGRRLDHHAARRRTDARGAPAVTHADHHRRLRHRRRHPGAAQLQGRARIHPGGLRAAEFIDTLATSTPITAHVNVDFELHGCPINKHQLLEVLIGVPAMRASRTSRRTASASSASCAAPSACWCAASRVSAR